MTSQNILLTFCGFGSDNSNRILVMREIMLKFSQHIAAKFEVEWITVRKGHAQTHMFSLIGTTKAAPLDLNAGPSSDSDNDDSSCICAGVCSVKRRANPKTPKTKPKPKTKEAI